jgi:hypothetical protein
MPLRWQGFRGPDRPQWPALRRRNDGPPAHLSFCKGRRFVMASVVGRPVVLIVEDESLLRISGAEMVAEAGSTWSRPATPTKQSLFSQPVPTSKSSSLTSRCRDRWTASNSRGSSAVDGLRSNSSSHPDACPSESGTFRWADRSSASPTPPQGLRRSSGAWPGSRDDRQLTVRRRLARPQFDLAASLSLRRPPLTSR